MTANRFHSWLRRGAPGGNADATDAAELVLKGRIVLDGRPLAGLQRRAVEDARKSFDRLEAFIDENGVFDREKFRSGRNGKGKLHHAPIAGVKITDARRRSSARKCAGCGQPLDGPPGNVTAGANTAGTWHAACRSKATGRGRRTPSGPNRAIR